MYAIIHQSSDTKIEKALILNGIQIPDIYTSIIDTVIQTQKVI